MQQEQVQTQQGQIQELLDMVKTLNGGAPALLSAMMEGAEGAAKGRVGGVGEKRVRVGGGGKEEGGGGDGGGD
jgi:hypothetical protein